MTKNTEYYELITWRKISIWLNLVYNNITYNNFLISEDGKVKNVKTNHIYKHYINSKGYVVLTLPMGNRGKVKTIRLHKALAETFIPNPNGYKIVHHKDENKSNFSLSNLEWTTNKLNTQYHLQELHKNTPFFNNRKLTKKDTDFIKNNKGKISYSKLAILFNVSKTTIVNVMNGKLYNNGVW